MVGQASPAFSAVFAADHRKRRRECHGLRRGHAGAVDQVPGELHQVVGHRLAAQHRGTADAEAFSKSDHQQFRPDALLISASAPLLAGDANAVGIVDQQPCVLLFCGIVQRGQGALSPSMLNTPSVTAS